MSHQEINQKQREIKKLVREYLTHPNYKQCFECGDIKPLEEFNPSKRVRPAEKGVCIVCVECVNKRN